MDRLVFLRADRAVPYGDLMDVLEILRTGNYRMKLVALEGVPERRGAALGGRSRKALNAMSDLDTRAKAFPAAVVFRGRGRARASCRRRGAGGRAHAVGTTIDDSLGAQCDRDRGRIVVAAYRGHRPAAGSGCRCFGRLAGARRAEGRDQADRFAQGHADRDRRSRSGRDARTNRRSPRKTNPRSRRYRPRLHRNR